MNSLTYLRLPLVAIILSLLTIGFTIWTLMTESDAVEEPSVVTSMAMGDEPEATEYAVLQEELPIYSAEDLETLALVIYQEAGGDACSDDTRLKVGTVVMNRVADHRFPDTLRDVITERGQYGRLYWTGPEWPERASKPEEAHAVARAYDCAEQVLQGYRALPADTVYQAEFEQGDEVVAHQDGFYFCRWK
jgi:hypothetical protein